MRRNAFPDMQVEVEKLVADEDNVAFAYSYRNSQRRFFGVKGTNTPVKERGMQISRFRNGQMVERWGSTDELGILKQIGAEVTMKKP